MKTNKLLFISLMTFAFSTIHAQNLKGISVNSDNEKMVVVLNGQPMCEGTHSCFIANLKPGTYNIQVFSANGMNGQVDSRHLLYDNKIKYEGLGINTIQIASSNEANNKENYPALHRNVMGRAEFKDFYESIRDQNFDDGRMQRIDILPAEISFTTEQCCQLSHLFDFEDKLTQLLIKLYPRVVDKALFYKAIDTLNFQSNQKKVEKFIERYNKQQGWLQ